MIGFYAAYHSARWGLQCDARFDDLDSLKRLHPDLIPDDRRTAKHKARRRSNAPDFGVNDLVLLMYPTAAPAYEQLHQASIEVRYNQGTPDVLPPAERMLEMVDAVHAIIVDTVMNG